MALSDRDRDNDRLKTGNCGREDQPSVVAMQADKGSNSPFRYAVTGLVCELLLPIFVLIGNVECL